MNIAQIKEKLALLFPLEILGFKRPAESIASDNDFFVEMVQLIAKDPVRWEQFNMILSILLSNDARLKDWHDELAETVSSQNWRIVTETLAGYMTPELLAKINTIAENAEVNQNAFASIKVGNTVYTSAVKQGVFTISAGNNVAIALDTNNGTISISAKDTTYSLVSTTAPGLCPQRDGSTNKFLRADGTWATISIPTYNNATQTTAGLMSANDKKAVDTLASTFLKLAGGTLVGLLKISATIPDDSNDTTVPTTSWVRKIVNSLISTVTSSTAFKKHIVVSYLAAQNGYIKFGDWFGYLIIQWGVTGDSGYTNNGLNEHSRIHVIFPLALTVVYYCNGSARSVDSNARYVQGYVYNVTKTGFYMLGSDNSDGNAHGGWFAVGKA